MSEQVTLNRKDEAKAVNLPVQTAIDNLEDKESTIASNSTDGIASPCHYDDTPQSVVGGGLALASISQRILDLEYAVRGMVLNRALEIAKDFSGYPFNKLVKCHIGNPHAVGMPAVAYIREVLSLVTNPQLGKVDESVLRSVYAPDSIERGKKYLKYLTEPGAYTHSQGAPGLREEIADWLEHRDGVRPSIEQLYLTNGASDGIETTLQLLLGDASRDAIMVPLPQYPLYSATITKIGGKAVFYELKEDDGWSLNLEDVESAYNKAIADGLNVKAMAVICPGNPASTLLSKEQKIQILKFCSEKQLLVMADEVYQDNVYVREEEEESVAEAVAAASTAAVLSDDDEEVGGLVAGPDSVSSAVAAAVAPTPITGYPPPRSFTSFRKALLESGLPVQLASYHSSSKGLVGECGFRGGVMVLDNVAPETRAVILKLRSITLCPNTIGQIVMALVVNPPRPGSYSYPKYRAETTVVFQQLKKKANLVYRFFNSLEGTSCQRISGGMYAFPRFQFTKQAIDTARGMGMTVNQFYCMELLEATGIVTVPGCGFGEVEGSFHIRMTILPSLEDLKEALEKYRQFHTNFWRLHC